MTTTERRIRRWLFLGQVAFYLLWLVARANHYWRDDRPPASAALADHPK